MWDLSLRTGKNIGGVGNFVHRQKLLADPTFKGASNYGCAAHGTRDLSLTATNA